MIRGTAVGGSGIPRPAGGDYLYRGQPFLAQVNADILRERNKPADPEAEAARREQLKATGIRCGCPHYWSQRHDRWVVRSQHRLTCHTRQTAGAR